jgi:hypothetical protein
MARTWQSLLDDARVLLQDTREPYRLQDSEILSLLNRALQELGRLRPDAFFTKFDLTSGEIIVPVIEDTDPDPQVGEDTDDVADPVVDAVEALDGNVSVPSQFHSALVYFVVGSAEVVDDEYR